LKEILAVSSGHERPRSKKRISPFDVAAMTDSFDLWGASLCWADEAMVDQDSVGFSGHFLLVSSHILYYVVGFQIWLPLSHVFFLHSKNMLDMLALCHIFLVSILSFLDSQFSNPLPIF
jgi:hypothetical protein